MEPTPHLSNMLLSACSFLFLFSFFLPSAARPVNITEWLHFFEQRISLRPAAVLQETWKTPCEARLSRTRRSVLSPEIVRQVYIYNMARNAVRLRELSRQLTLISAAHLSSDFLSKFRGVSLPGMQVSRRPEEAQRWMRFDSGFARLAIYMQLFR